MMPEEKPREPRLERALEQENIPKAIRAVKANRGAAGVDGMQVGELEAHLQKHWEAIKTKLQNIARLKIRELFVDVFVGVF